VHRHRRAQRLHRGAHRAAELHRDAGLPVHPARLHHLLPQLIERKTIIGGIDEAAEGDWLAPIFRRQDPGGLFVWLGDAGIMIDVFERGNREGQPVVDGIPMLIVWALAW
jgi:hypothetical protein